MVAKINVTTIAGRKHALQASASSITGICFRVLNVDSGGVRGGCGGAAVALNRAIFAGKGRYLVMIERALCERRKKWVGHVAVHHDGQLYDAKGVFEYRDYIDWMAAAGTERDGMDAFYRGLPSMPHPPARARIAALHSNVICFWATEAQVIRAFVGTMRSNLAVLERLYRYMRAHPNAARTSRHRTRFTDEILQRIYGWKSEAERARLRREASKSLRESLKSLRGLRRAKSPLVKRRRKQCRRARR